MILADPADQRLLGGLRHLQAPLPEIASLPINPIQVLIVENRDSALTVPDMPGLVVIHSLGNNLELLSTIPWLEHAKPWYWGDIDRAGFTLLSRARSHLPDLASVLMNPEAFEAHRQLAVWERAKADPPLPTLTESEKVTLAFLGRTPESGFIRLEQERLSPRFVAETLTKQLLRPDDG